MKDTARKVKSTEALSLKASELRYRRLFEAAQDGILILDADSGAIRDVNPFLIDMLGYPREEIMEKKLWEVGAFKDIEASKDAFLALQQNEYIRYRDLPLRAKDGRLIQVEFVSNVYLVGSKLVIQCNIRDITERKQAHDALLKSEALMREKSVRDHLTGLFNRRYMEETLDREIVRASRKQASLGVIMLDVDDFKCLNDTYGHATGDTILRELGSLLLGHIREDDIACRYGDDEFIIVMPDATREIAHERAKLLREKSRHFQIRVEGRTLKLETISLSFGVATFPMNGTTSTTMLRAVDDELYKAKLERQQGHINHTD
jgi:diguanylate cyclase (GGDEF)-like protein/PAS domain S-box-containing protein